MSRARTLADYVSSGDELADKLDLSGGAMTGAITTNSTFDGVDVATRDATLTSTTTLATAAAPKASPAFTGTPTGITAAHLTGAAALPAAVTGGSGLNALSASNLSDGTVPDARFPATLPATSGANLTALPAANVTGVLPEAVTGGSGLDALPAVIIKTAIAVGEAAGDLSPVDNEDDTYTIKLNTEYDPYNIISISSNVVTVSEAGKYLLEFNSGHLIGYNDTGLDSYAQMSLRNSSGTLISLGQEGAVRKWVTDGISTSLSSSLLGDISANATFKIFVETNRSNWTLYGWTSVTGSASHGWMKFTKIAS